MKTARLLLSLGALFLPFSAIASQKQDDFAVNVFRDVVAQQEGNVVFSPASLENALGTLEKGARGDTLRALKALPTGRKGVKSAMRVESADAIFVSDAMKLKAVDVQEIHRVSFAAPKAAAKTINAWCDKKTHGLVPSIVSKESFNSDTRMVVVNAVYLNGKWLHPFDKEVTDPHGVFHTAKGKKATVPMMCQTDCFLYAEGEDWRAIALPYDKQGRAGEQGCFIGILPKGDARQFATTLTPKKYNDIRKSLKKSHECMVTLPRMEVDTQPFPLDDILIRNGLGSLYAGADFSGFADEPLHVTQVLQRCHVKVDEEKTEAAAVTAIRVDCYGCEGPRPKIITFDRPFIWAIDDLTTGSAPFFMGLFEQP